MDFDSNQGYVLDVTFDLGENHPLEQCAMFDCSAYATTCIVVWHQDVICQEDHGCELHEWEITAQIRDEWKEGLALFTV